MSLDLKCVHFIAFISEKASGYRGTSDSQLKMSVSFIAIFIFNLYTRCTLHHLSAPDILYKMFTPVYTSVH